MKKYIFSILGLLVVFTFFIFFTKEKIYAGDALCSIVRWDCDLDVSYCGSYTTSCPCPDGTCYINCTSSCHPGTKTKVCPDPYPDGPGTVTTTFSAPCCTSTNSTYPSGSSVSCCTQIVCDCTPTCKSGSSYTYSGPLCSAGKAKCSESNECSSCTDYGNTCYYPETNLSFVQADGSTSGPAAVSMVVDGKTYQLSTDANNPTHIKLPASGSSNVQVSTPTFTAPTTSRGANYYYQVNNYGVNNEWKTWTTCGADEDFCTIMPNANNVQAFDPNNLTVNQVLEEGATGQIAAMYATTDKCSDAYKYSLPIEGYYIVDSLPETPAPCTPGSGSCPWLSGISTNTTSKGCSTTTYSGTEANNELNIRAEVTDPNNNDEIQAFTIWFTKTTSPSSATIAASYTGSNLTDVGIMIKKDGETWGNPLVYATNSNLTWGRVPMVEGLGYINVNGTDIIVISDVSVTQDTKVTFDYKIRYINNTNNLSGMYSVYGGSLDTYMVNGNILDQSYFTKLFDWGVDLVAPVADDMTQQVNDATSIYVTWSASDSASGIERILMNGYRTGGIVTDNVTLYIPTLYTTSKGSITLNPIPVESEIGNYADTNAWVFSNTGEKDLLNIGANENGNINIYVTAYDRACNTNGTSQNIDLNPWFATRGGALYSRGNISTIVKDVSASSELDEAFNPKTAMTKARIDLGTELISTMGTSVSQLIHQASGVTRVLQMEDTNNSTSYWYTQLLKKLDRYKGGLASFTKLSSDTKVSDSCTGTQCYMYSTGDISIPSGYSCDLPTLFITDGNIYIEPNVTSGSAFSGCIFVAQNNIYIGGGRYLSTGGKTMFDYLEGYLIADKQVIFSLVDQSQTLRDGIEIFGGITAFGTDIPASESAISIERNMRLLNQTIPSVVLTYDNKYPSISTIFFGTEYQLYKQEIGFKTF